MGTGTITLLWYVLCTGFVFFLLAIATGLSLFGKRFGKRSRFHVRTIERASTPPEVDAGDDAGEDADDTATVPAAPGPEGDDANP